MSEKHEHDLRMLRAAIRSTSAIKRGDRTAVLKLLRNKINEAVRGDLPQAGIPYGLR